MKRQLMLAVYGTQRKPRRVPRDEEQHARTWARRWWVVEVDETHESEMLELGVVGPAAIARVAIDADHTGRHFRSDWARILERGQNGKGGLPPVRGTKSREGRADG